MSSTSAMATKQSVFSSLATYAKEHHASVNAAYSTYYSPGVSTRPSMESKNSSSTQSSSVKSTSSISKAWKAAKKHATEHHDSVTNAYSSYYRVGMSTGASSAMAKTTPKASFETERSVESTESVGSVRRSWEAAKKHAKEHHRSVNAAYGSYYGGAAIRA